MTPQPKNLLHLLTYTLLACLAAGCSVLSTQAPAPVVAALPKAEIVRIPILLVPNSKPKVETGSRIVIADVEGPCAAQVKDALMRRLTDNSNYNVLTRENLNQIIGEADLAWAGRFNTETAEKLGQLMGASLWIVGRVGYCGQVLATSDRQSDSVEFNILAALQIINIATGKVLVSSASEGRYLPKDLKELDLALLRRNSTKAAPDSDTAASANNTSDPNSSQEPAGTPQPAASNTDPEHREERNFSMKFAQFKTNLGEKILKKDSDLPKASQEEKQQKVLEYIILKTAEDLANDFADKFFSRPSWDHVEMWYHPDWLYGAAVRLVKLGHCATAVKFMEGAAATELPFLNENQTSQYLHNYGVALICSNKLEMGERKLRASFRIATQRSTIKMIDLARRIFEWSLEVAPESETEVLRFVTLDPKTVGS